MVLHSPNALFNSVRRALLIAIIAFFIFLPITGMVLKGYEVTFHWQRPLLLSALTLVGAFLFEFFGPPLRAFIEERQSRKAAREPLTTTSKGVPKLALIMLFFAGLILPFFLNAYWLGVFIFALIYILLGLGLNIVVGLAGLLDLGFVAFYAVGAYVYALGSTYFDLGFWTSIPLAAGIAALFGTILGFPVLRMHGDYLAIVTLGFGEIIHLVLVNWVDVTGGPSGLSAPSPTFLGFEFRRRASQGGVAFHEYFGLDYSAEYRQIFLFLCLFLVVALITFFCYRLKQMPIGRTWEALKEDEIACRSLGINHVTVKLSAFSLGAMIGGIAGVFFAGFQELVNPSSFTFFESAIILAVVVLGGLGSIPGVILAAIFLSVMPEVLRDFAEYRILIFGSLMVLMMIWRPSGLIKGKRRHFQLKTTS